MLKADISDATKLYLVEDFDKVLCLDLVKTAKAVDDEPAVDDELSAVVEEKIAERAAAKKEKNFARADEIRAELLAMGIEIKDTREGVIWNKI